MASTPQETPSASTGEEQGGGKRQGMLAVNDLNYVLAPDLSVSVNNTFKNHFAQSSTYTNSQRAILIFNSGADYGDMRTSSLNFVAQITAPTGAAGYFGKNGSVLNLIRSITISSRSGDEISRITDLNHLSAMTMALRYSDNWMKTVGQTIGVGSGLLHTTHGQVQQQFSIPLYLLSDFFAYGRLMPAMALAGLRLEIEWENPSTAFQSIDTDGNAVGAAITAYSITNMYVSLRSVQLTDGTQRALNEMSAVNGLEVVYCDYERTEASLASGVSLQLEVRKAASRALKAYLSVRETANVTLGTVDSFRTEDWDYSQWQWQLGSLYFPQQPVKAYNSTTRLAISESYNHSLIAFNTYKGDQQRCSALPLYTKDAYLDNTFADNVGSVNPTTGTLIGTVGVTAATGVVAGTSTTFEKDYSVGDIFSCFGTTAVVLSIASDIAMTVTVLTADIAAGKAHRNLSRTGTSLIGNANTPWGQKANPRASVAASQIGQEGTFSNGRSTVCVLLERSDLFNLTGVPINNSRVLSAQATFATTRTRTATIFLKYVKLARIFLNNLEVEQ